MNECNPIQGFLQICRLGLPCWQQRRRLQRTPSLSPVPPGRQWRWWAHWDRWNIPTINQSSSQSHINDGLKIEQEKAMTHRLPCLSMTSRRSKGRIEARNKVFTGIRFYYLCLCPCLIWASTVTNSIKVVLTGGSPCWARRSRWCPAAGGWPGEGSWAEAWRRERVDSPAYRHSEVKNMEFPSYQKDIT